ncbi:MAG: MFS transporter [Peptococcaceae bacterium]|jgi:MFS family permease|nr:MFS transporter [Peptococcaceae bacterium]
MQKPSLRIWNRSFIGVFVANCAVQFAHQMANSLVSKFTDSLGATATLVGAVAGTFAVTSLLFKFVSGPAIDAWNRRYIMMFGMSVMAISYLGYSISTTVPMIVAFRLLQGAGQAFTTTCCLTVAADSLPPEKFSSGIGIYSMAQAAFMAIGPAIGLALVRGFGYRLTFRISTVIMLLGIFASAQIRVEPAGFKKIKISLRSTVSREVLLSASSLFFLMISFCIIQAFLIIYAEGKGVEGIGYYFTVYAGTLLISRPLVGKLTDRFGIARVIVPAMCCFALSFFLISTAASLPAFLLAAFISSFGYGACQPAIQTLAMKCVPLERRGAASSTCYIAQDLGTLIGPTIAGMLVDSAGYAIMWRAMTAPIFLSMIVVYVTRGRIGNIEKVFRERQQAAPEGHR